MLPSVPRIASVSSKLILASAATGAAYFNASPIDSTLLKLLFAAAVSPSATRVASSPARPNWRIVAAMIPEARVASVPVARAMSITAPVMVMIWSGLKPARPSSPISSATSEAV